MREKFFRNAGELCIEHNKIIYMNFSHEEDIISISNKRSQPINAFFDQQKKILSVNSPKEKLNFESIQAIIQDPNSTSRYDIINKVDSELKLEDNKPLLEISPLHKGLNADYLNISQENPQKEIVKPYQLNNFYIGEDILDDNLINFIEDNNVQKVLILSDTNYTRNMDIYQKIINQLNSLNIPFVEFTNIQPNMNRRMLFKMAEFAFLHEVNSLFVVGCDATIDLSKLLLLKLFKPNLIKLKRQKFKPILQSNFSVLSFPTFVVPDIKVNSKSSFDNSLFLKRSNWLSSSIFLSHPIDNSDAVFYYVPLFFELDKNKIVEILHETYFRLVFNYFDIKALESEKFKLINDIKIIAWYLDFLNDKKTLTSLDIKVILKIIAYTVNGTHFIDHGFYWTWYKLESSLSKIVNSKKSHGLALFLPSFLEYILIDENYKLKEQVRLLGVHLFNSSTAEGCIYNFIKHIEKHHLPVKLLDIAEIVKIDYKLLFYIISRSSNYIGSYRMTRTIVKNLSIW